MGKICVASDGGRDGRGPSCQPCLCPLALCPMAHPHPKIVEGHQESDPHGLAVLGYLNTTRREESRAVSQQQWWPGVLDGVQRSPDVIILGLQELGRPATFIQEPHGQHL